MLLPGSETLALRSDDRFIVVTDTQTGISQPLSVSGPMTSSADRNMIASDGTGGKIRIYDTQTYELQNTLESHTSIIRTIGFPGGRANLTFGVCRSNRRSSGRGKEGMSLRLRLREHQQLRPRTPSQSLVRGTSDRKLPTFLCNRKLSLSVVSIPFSLMACRIQQAHASRLIARSLIVGAQFLVYRLTSFANGSPCFLSEYCGYRQSEGQATTLYGEIK